MSLSMHVSPAVLNEKIELHVDEVSEPLCGRLISLDTAFIGLEDDEGTIVYVRTMSIWLIRIVGREAH